MRSRIATSQSRPHGQNPSSSSTDGSARTCTGPGGASIEIGPNMWTASGLKIDSAPTDVVWARGREFSIPIHGPPNIHQAFDNKIVTSARNGEIIYWDINKSGSKYGQKVDFLLSIYLH